MLIDTRRMSFDMQEIDNRRFMFSPQTGELILGKQYKGRQLYKSHAEEHFDSGAQAAFDSFIRGWIGTGGDYQNGVIHFAPNISANNIPALDNAFSTLQMFSENGANENTVVRGFGNTWEQPLNIIIPKTERSKEMDAINTGKTATFSAETPQSTPVIPINLRAEKPVEKLKEITDRLEQGIKELFDSERYKEYLRVMSRFYNYSFNNTLLIAMQKPDASLIAGFNSWKNQFQRSVKKGEKGIKIIAPSPYKIKQEMEKIDPKTQKPIIDKDGKPVIEEKEITIPAYKVVSVFDVSQTEGRELPDIAVDTLTGDVEHYRDFFTALEKTSPVPIGFEKIKSGAHGYYNLEEKRIALDEGMSELQTLKTAIHEIAHAKLHDIDLKAPAKEKQTRADRRTREVEAESVAYTVCQHYGLDTSDYSFGYVAGWSSGRELAELKNSLEIIRSTANEIINSIDEHIAVIQKEQAIKKEQSEIPAPDATISVDDMQEYGYSWDGMLPLQEANAMQFFEKENAVIYRLYPDGTEGAVENIEDLRSHAETGGIFGIEKTSWKTIAAQAEVTAQKEKDGINTFVEGQLNAAGIEFTHFESAEQFNAWVKAHANPDKKQSAQENEPNKDTFSIYQLKRNEETQDLRFEPYYRLQNAGQSLNPANYDLIYTAPLTPDMSLEQIFERFNIDHPKDFKGHSLSVSDVVVLHQNGQETAHYVDSIGYKQVPEFLQPPQPALVPDDHLTGDKIKTPRGTFSLIDMTHEQMKQAGYGFHHQSDDGKYDIMGNGTRAFAIAAEQPEKVNPLKHIEDTVEQNDNSFDGIINNTPQTPTVGELEQKVKAGESISLVDLANAIKADKERGKEEKPSVRAQLKAAKEKTAPKKAKTKKHELEV
ncbi:MAG: YodL domain-containing protein [Christensenellales bacterium]|jgi:antirestriction protein ArdC